MNIFQAIILGIVQGATEFLPVSSSGHLLLFEQAFHVQENQILFYTIMLHVGSLLAVIWVFRWDIISILSHPTKKPFIYLVIATIPGALVGVALGSKVNALFGSGSLLGPAFLLTAIVLTASEQVKTKELKFEDSSYKTPVIAGIFQAVAAVFPGLSRSGSTIAGGLISGLSRSSAARFSFLMSIPIIIGSAAVDIKDVASGGIGDNIMWGSVLVCIVVSAAVSFVAIDFLLKFIRKHKMYGFAIYTAVLGALVLLDQNVLHLVFK